MTTSDKGISKLEKKPKGSKLTHQLRKPGTGCSPLFVKIMGAVGLVTLVAALVVGFGRAEGRCQIVGHSATGGGPAGFPSEIQVSVSTGNDQFWPAVIRRVHPSWAAAQHWVQSY